MNRACPIAFRRPRDFTFLVPDLPGDTELRLCNRVLSAYNDH
jgi:hypothetical protein